MGWKKENLHVVPISAFEGTCLVDTKSVPEWYKGKSFLETLDDMSNVSNERGANEENEEKVEANRFVCKSLIFDELR